MKRLDDPIAAELAALLPELAAVREVQRAYSEGAFTAAAAQLRRASDEAEKLAQIDRFSMEIPDRSAFTAALGSAMEQDAEVVKHVVLGQLHLRRDTLRVVLENPSLNYGDLIELAAQLREAADAVESFPLVYIGPYARQLRSGSDGRLPNLAFARLNTWALDRDVGPRPLARALVDAGLLDDERWFPESINSQFVDSAIIGWEKRIKDWRGEHRNPPESPKKTKKGRKTVAARHR